MKIVQDEVVAYAAAAAAAAGGGDGGDDDDYDDSIVVLEEKHQNADPSAVVVVAAVKEVETTSKMTISQQHRANQKAAPVQRLQINKDSIAPFNPTCDQAMEKALQLFQFSSSSSSSSSNNAANHVLFDLGCGDARMLLYSAEKVPHLKCVGIDLDPSFVQRGRSALQKLAPSIQHRVDIREGNLLQLLYDYNNNKTSCSSSSNRSHTETASDTNTDTTATTTGVSDNTDDSILGRDCRNLSLLNDATAIFVFLLPQGIQKIQPLLDIIEQQRLKDNKPLQVIAYMFSIRAWEPPTLVDRTTKGEAPLYLYQFGMDRDNTR